MNANIDGGSTSGVNSNSWFGIGAVVRLGFLALVGVALSAASIEAQPFAYVPNVNSNNVSVIDTATNTEVTIIRENGRRALI